MDYSGKIIRKTPVTPSQTGASGVWQLDEAMQATKNNTWPVPNVPNPISRSLRFRASATAYLSRTPATATNRKTWTWSGWVKRGVLSTNQVIFSARSGTSWFNIAFDASTNSISVNDVSGGTDITVLLTTQVFRDPSAWYHIVFALDTTQATSSNRCKLYINGSQVTSFSTATYPTLNFDGFINTANEHLLGQFNTTSRPLDGYMTEINFVDGQALTPSSFGGTNAVTGVWEPRVYTGTYGTNGFYLPFSNITNTTTLGNDFSGNGNNWTTNNISLTAGSTYDSMLDVPTQWIGYNTGDAASVTRGNYAVLNPLRTNGGTVTNGNLTASQAASAYVGFSGSMAMRTGKWYWEVTCTSIGFVTSIGITNSNSTSGFTSGIWTYHYDGTKYIGASNSAYGASYTSGDVIGFAFDADAGSLTCYKNNVSQGVLVSGLSTDDYYAYATLYGTWNMAFNFGQRPFSYTPPSGFLPLCTTNLSSPTILQGNQYFDATTYTGNGTSQSITNSGSMQPDWVWTKSRSTTYNNLSIDAVRGVGNFLIVNATDAESSNANSITAFNSTGYSVGSALSWNASGQTYVGWQWNAGGSTVTNTAGSISAQVRANPTAGFSIVTFTAPASGTCSVGHGLGVKPSMVIVKCRSVGNSGWFVWHQALGDNNTDYLELFRTAAEQSYSTMWGTVGRTSTLLGFTQGGTLEANATHVAYAFAAVSGYSAFGSYTGNGSSDGPFIYTGFRPRYVMMKRTDTIGGWLLLDSARNPSNVVTQYLYANASDSEAAYSGWDFTSNGFKLRNTSGELNASGGNYIYMAFAENPFKNALAR